MRQLFDGADMYRASARHSRRRPERRRPHPAAGGGRGGATTRSTRSSARRWTLGIPTQGRILLTTRAHFVGDAAQGRLHANAVPDLAHLANDVVHRGRQAAWRDDHRLRAAQQLQRLHPPRAPAAPAVRPRRWKRKPLRCRGTEPCATGRNAGAAESRGKEFMDAALDAYRRHLALHKWRQVMDMQRSELAGKRMAPEQAIREAGRFPGLGAYQDVWERWWEAQVVAVAGSEGAASGTHRDRRERGARRGDRHPAAEGRRAARRRSVLQDVPGPSAGPLAGGRIRQPGRTVNGGGHASGPRLHPVSSDVLPPVRKAVVEGAGGGVCRCPAGRHAGAHRGRGLGTPPDGQRLAGH